MYPSKELPYSGVFVKAQYDYMKKNLVRDVHIFYMRQKITSKYASLLKYVLAYFRFIPHLFKNYKIIHVHYLGYLAPLAILYITIWKNAKLVLTCHGGDVNADMPAAGLKNRLYRKIIKKFHRIIIVGEALKEPLYDKLGCLPDNIICAGIDADVFYPEQKKRDFDFLIVGSFLEIKGLDVLNEALNRLKLEKPLRLCFVGNGPLEGLINQMNKKAEVTIIHNLNQSELRDIYQKSKYLIFPSKNDAFGLVVTESLYCGTPVILSSTGGAQFQVNHGVNGFIYEGQNADELAKTMKSALAISNSNYELLSRRAASCNKQHSLKNVCQSLNQIYTDLNTTLQKENLDDLLIKIA